MMDVHLNLYEPEELEMFAHFAGKLAILRRKQQALAMQQNQLNQVAMPQVAMPGRSIPSNPNCEPIGGMSGLNQCAADLWAQAEDAPQECLGPKGLYDVAEDPGIASRQSWEDFQQTMAKQDAMHVMRQHNAVLDALMKADEKNRQMATDAYRSALIDAQVNGAGVVVTGIDSVNGEAKSERVDPDVYWAAIQAAAKP